MDINSAEKSLAKLLAYVQDLADTKPRLYRKSRGKLKDLADTCTEVVKCVAIILQDEVLATDDVEFGSGSSIVSALNSMQNDITQVCSFAGVRDKVDTSSVVSDRLIHTEPISEPVPVSANAKKQALRSYRNTLQKLSTIDYKYDAVKRFADLLWFWFDTRFVKTVHGTGFKYSMKRFPTWIRDIVILYGKAIRDNDYIRFDNQFRWWIQSLSDSANSSNKYAVPYWVYEFERDMKPEDMSLEAVVLWDILIDTGMSELCTSVSDELRIREDAVYSLCGDINPSVLDGYMNYADHPEILINLGWEVRAHA